VKPGIDKAAFGVLARRSGAPLTDGEIANVYEGYLLMMRLVEDLQPPADPQVEPALIFKPGTVSKCL
jgi:hypothetical protein